MVSKECFESRAGLHVYIGLVYSDSFQRISCSYKTTFPEELNVYLTSTCCCILPVLFQCVSCFKAKKQECKRQVCRNGSGGHAMQCSVSGGENVTFAHRRCRAQQPCYR